MLILLCFTHLLLSSMLSSSVYVDDILVTGIDVTGIASIKTYWHQHLNIRDLGTLKYFLGIKFAYRPGKLVLN